ncbi:MAG: hypothetical protein QXI07_09030 [Pyrobaculum sp.]
MICEWLARGALCSQAYEKYKDHRGFFKLAEIPELPGAARVCHGLELAAAVVVDELLIPYFYKRRRNLSKAVVDALWALSAVVTPSAAALNGLLPDGVVAAVQGPCIFGLELNRPTVFIGPPPLLEPIREYTSSPIFAPFSEFVALAEADYSELSAVARKYGAEAFVSCLADAPAPAYVLLCDVHEVLGRLLAEAVGAAPASGEAQLRVVDGRVLVKR